MDTLKLLKLCKEKWPADLNKVGHFIYLSEDNNNLILSLCCKDKYLDLKLEQDDMYTETSYLFELIKTLIELDYPEFAECYKTLSKKEVCSNE